jgi:predicted DNA-binding transcriptional regulator AlpA
MASKSQLPKAETHSADLSNINIKPAIPLELENFDKLPDSGLVRLPVVTGLLGCSASSVWRNVRNGTLPAPVKLTPNITGWRVSELRSVLNRGAA